MSKFGEYMFISSMNLVNMRCPMASKLRYLESSQICTSESERVAKTRKTWDHRRQNSHLKMMYKVRKYTHKRFLKNSKKKNNNGCIEGESCRKQTNKNKNKERKKKKN